ncbi:MAG: 16S rRNA (cytidine(1402)-2'-O)-methyltransferase [Elusimicrobiota bacterium]|jgi:16S rRNA (cytidine1402-2'-O)-methyltransferase|nr:16S rRNA (cytidine(1402)-2'-O)-methyltransferase [Elusimicrobiota bacterium]
MLYIVPTPIGNLQDITLRALDALKTADFILCEDTRHTARLADSYALKAKLVRYNENDASSIERCLNLLKEGKKCALVSDAGTPCISDPGWRLVQAARQNNIKVETLPGPSALTCALSGAGISGGGFSFLGFMPRKQGKIVKLISTALLLDKPVVIYESPYRIIKLLEIIESNFGSEVKVIIARELTKTFEEWISGLASEVILKLKERKKILGEFVVILDGRTKEDAKENEEEDIS